MGILSKKATKTQKHNSKLGFTLLGRRRQSTPHRAMYPEHGQPRRNIP